MLVKSIGALSRQINPKRSTLVFIKLLPKYAKTRQDGEFMPGP